MHPVLFDVGGFSVHAYGALGAIAFLLGAGLTLWRGRRLGMNIERVADVIFWMSVTGLIGARLLFVLQNPGALQHIGQLLDLRSGGLVFYGAFLTGLPTGLFLLRRAGLPAAAFFDILGTAFPLSHAISRAGCFLAGCCYGLPHDGALAVTFPPTGVAPPGTPLHPVQLYEALALLTIAAVTNALYRRPHARGQVFLLYLVLYAATRAVVEMFRGDTERGFFLPAVLGEALTYSQGMSLLVAAVAVALFIRGARQEPVARGPSTP